MTGLPISRARARQVEAILRLYLIDRAQLDEAVAAAAWPAYAAGFAPPGGSGPGDPVGQGALALATDAARAAALWRCRAVWAAYQQLPPDEQTVVALTYWYGGTGLPWRRVCALLHIAQNAYYKRRRAALRRLARLLPPESQDPALWLGVAPDPDAANG